MSPESPRQISNSGAGAYEAALSTDLGRAFAAWYDTRDGNAEIYLRARNADGSPAGPERRLTNNADQSYEPGIARVGDAIGIWAVAAKLGVWTPDGANRWTAALPTRSRNPVLPSDGRALVAAIRTGRGGSCRKSEIAFAIVR